MDPDMPIGWRSGLCGRGGGDMGPDMPAAPIQGGTRGLASGLRLRPYVAPTTAAGAAPGGMPGC